MSDWIQKAADAERLTHATCDAQLAAEREAHALTQRMLHDLAHEKLPQWLAETMLHRAELLEVLRDNSRNMDGDRCCISYEPHHEPKCLIGLWLRRIGGPKEVQRQVEVAYQQWESEEAEKARRAAQPRRNGGATEISSSPFIPDGMAYLFHGLAVSAPRHQLIMRDINYDGALERVGESDVSFSQSTDAIPSSNPSGENQNATDDDANNGR